MFEVHWLDHDGVAWRFFFHRWELDAREPFSLGIAEVWSWYIRCVLHLPSGVAFG